MPIRTMPLRSIDEKTLRDMIRFGAQEDRTLEFKRELKLDAEGKTLTREGKTEFLIDVTAMANGEGGAILYGGEQGQGEQRGQLVSLRGMRLKPDQLGLSLSQLLQSAVSERLPSLDQRPVELEDGSYCYIVRVPPSHLAPHMIRHNESPRDRWFYLRGTQSSDPMDTRQIKEAVLRTETAFERTRQRLEHRIRTVRDRVDRRRNRGLSTHHADVGNDFVALHFLPIFPPLGGHDLADPAIRELIKRTPPGGFTNYFDVTVSLDGISSERNRGGGGEGASEWFTLLRTGGLESVRCSDAGQGIGGGAKILNAVEIEKVQLTICEQARAFGDAGLVTTPLLLALGLYSVRGTALSNESHRHLGRTIDLDAVPIEPVVINKWEDVPRAMRRLFDVMWQAWGLERSPSYDDKGERLGAC